FVAGGRNDVAVPVHLIGASGAKQDWVDERDPKPNVHQPLVVECHLQQHVIEFRAKAAVIAPYASGQHLNAEAQRTEQFAKQAIELVTESAAMALDDLFMQQGNIEADRCPQRNIEVLERDGKQVLPVKIAQGGG